jgi:transposase-like protein
MRKTTVKFDYYKINHRHPWETVKLAIRFYNNQSRPTYREVSAKMAEKGIIVSHKTIYEWVQKFHKEATSLNKVKELRVKES